MALEPSIAFKLPYITNSADWWSPQVPTDFAEEPHYLPAYSPNLNPIERLWKVMHEYVSNNHYFKTAKEFRDKIDEFLTVTFSQITTRLRSTITDNFQTLGLAPSG